MRHTTSRRLRGVATRSIRSGRRRSASQPWKTFVRNHAQGIVACDFLVAVTARFRILFVFVALEIGSRRILHCNVTAHPTAEWTLQQLRDALPSDHPYQFLLHDRDTVFSSELDAEVKSTFGLRLLGTPVRAPQASAYCERLPRGLPGRSNSCRLPDRPAIFIKAKRDWMRSPKRASTFASCKNF